jgi:hypothetical protein
MNQTFSFPRFWMQLRWELATKGQSYLLTAAPLLVFMLLMMLPMAFATKYNDNLASLHYAAFFLPVLLGGSLYTNQAFSQYSSRDSGMEALMVPASRFEKLLSALLMNIIFWLPLLLLFLFLHNWCIDIANSKIPAGNQKYMEIKKDILEPLLLFFILFQGFVFLGSLYFTNSSFIKTLVVFIVLLFGIVYLNLWFAEYLTSIHGRLGTIPFSSWRIMSENIPNYHEIKHSQLIQEVTSWLPLPFLLALWYITYVRLGEKEI